MARYSISVESVEALRMLKNNLQNFTIGIKNATVDLKNAVVGMEDELGIYATDIIGLIENNVRIMTNANESFGILASIIDKKALDMQGILNGFSVSNNYIYGQESQYNVRHSYGEFENKLFPTGNLLKKYDEISQAHSNGKTTRQLEALKNYTGTSHAKINKYLDNIDVNEWSISVQNSINESVGILTDLIEMNELPQQGLLYRGINAKEIFGSDLDELQYEELIHKYQGREHQSKRFLSTSCKKSKAEQYAEQKNGAVVSFKTPKGTKGLFLGKLPSFGIEEAEVLLQRGTKYKIEKINFDGFLYHIEATIIGNEH